MKKVLTIAASDCSGGAGIQADLKTMTAFGVYGMSVITFLTSQNTTGIQNVFDITNDFISDQIDSCCNDILPDATKTGALFDTDKIETITEKIKYFQLKNIVIDPVMVCTANKGMTDCLLKQSAINTMITKLFPIADIITPNIPEAEVLFENITKEKIKIDTKEKMEEIAKIIAKFTKNGCILLKGGHFNECDDCLLYENNIIWLKGKKVNTKNTHGTGCSLSSAIACCLALGLDIVESCKKAKKYVYMAILNNPNIGRGNGPINHCFALKNQMFKSL